MASRVQQQARKASLGERGLAFGAACQPEELLGRLSDDEESARFRDSLRSFLSLGSTLKELEALKAVRASRRRRRPPPSLRVSGPS